MDSIILISQQKNIESICREIDELGRFALDLEFIPEKTFKPVLALLQIATDNSVYIIDPLSNLRLDDIWKKVADERIVKILHAAKEDLNIIRELSGLTPVNIFDTQVAAGFLGYGFPVGYKKLLDQLLKIQISKSESFTDWLCRPLSKLQLEYAFEDVCHLMKLTDKLINLLQQENRLSWVQEECINLYSQDSSSDNNYYNFTKIKGSRSLSGHKLAVLKALCDLRLEQAHQSNKPLRSILSDNTLLELSKKCPKRIETFDELRGINLEQARRYGTKIIATIEKSLALPKEEWPRWPNSQIISDNETLAGDILYAMLKVKAYHLKIAPELIATRSEIQKLITYFKNNCQAEKDLPLLQDWRFEIAGQHLLSMLDGKSAQIKMDLQTDPSVQLSH